MHAASFAYSCCNAVDRQSLLELNYRLVMAEVAIVICNVLSRCLLHDSLAGGDGPLDASRASSGH